MSRPAVLVLGADGQLGRALTARFPDAVAVGRAGCDITDPISSGLDWSAYDVVINAAAYTAVDAAESPAGRVVCWQVNAMGPSRLAALAREHGFTLVHFSTEYVFDGRHVGAIPETAPVAPLSVYGAAKAAGDLAVDGHVVVRPTWLVGNGRNFVRTMLGLAERGISPIVVEDQIGRPTFATDVADAVAHLLTTDAATGTYNVTSAGDPVSWAGLATEVFRLAGRHDLTIAGTSTREWFSSRPGAAVRPLNGVLDLSRIEASGFEPVDWRDRLATYVAGELTISPA